MSEPVILYQSIINALNITAWPTSVFLNFPVAALANGMTYDRYRVYGGMYLGTPVTHIYIDAGAPVTCDCLGIASHNVFSATSDATVSITADSVPIPYGDVGSFAASAFIAPSSAAPALLRFTPMTYRYWCVTLGYYPGPFTFDVGALYLGRAMTFERCIMQSHAPAPLNRSTEYYENKSESGQFLGRSILRKGFVTSVSMDKMTAPWVRDSFQPFVKAARLAPYFFAWNPGLYPDDVVFGMTADDIGAEYTGDRNRMKATWNIQGLGYDD
jgi:hypothetical protein